MRSSNLKLFLNKLFSYRIFSIFVAIKETIIFMLVYIDQKLDNLLICLPGFYSGNYFEVKFVQNFSV